MFAFGDLVSSGKSPEISWPVKQKA